MKRLGYAVALVLALAGMAAYQLLLNGGEDALSFALPRDARAEAWRVRVDSADPARSDDVISTAVIRVAPRGLCMLQAERRRA